MKRTYRRQTGSVPGPPLNRAPSSYGAAGAPGAMARYLYSCRLKVLGALERGSSAGWLEGNVVDRDTGKPMGRRWIRLRPEGGFEVRREAP